MQYFKFFLNAMFLRQQYDEYHKPIDLSSTTKYQILSIFSLLAIHSSCYGNRLIPCQSHYKARSEVHYSIITIAVFDSIQ